MENHQSGLCYIIFKTDMRSSPFPKFADCIFFHSVFNNTQSY